MSARSITWMLSIVLVLMLCSASSGFAQQGARNPIDCGKSLLQVAGQTGCFVSAPQPSERMSVNCSFQNFVSTGKLGNFDFVAIYFANNDLNGKCYVNIPDRQSFTQRVDREALQGRGWSAVRGADTKYAADFTLDGRRCIAFVRLGQPWQGGVRYRLTGHLCGSPTAGPSDADVERLLAGARFPQ